MPFLALLLARVLAPAAVLAIAGALLAPAMSQPSQRYLNMNVAQLAADRLWPSLGLLTLAMLIATAIWLPLAVLTARRGHHAGLTVAPVSVLAQGMAPFWTGILGLLLFSGSARLLPAAGAGSIVHAILPASALAVVLLGFLAHATYLRAINKQAMEAEAEGITTDTSLLRFEIATDWLDTLGRRAGLLLGALILIESVFSWPGLGRLFVDGLRNADVALRSTALFDLIALSAALTAAFGVSAELVQRRLDLRRAAAPVVLAAGGPFIAFRRASVEPRWLAVLTVALGGFILVALLILATTSTGNPLTARPDAALLPPGADGHLFGTDHLGRDMHARLAVGIYASLQQMFWLLFTTIVAAPFGLMAARLGRVVEGTLGFLLDALLTVSPLILVMVWLAHEPPGAGHQVFVGYAMGPLMVALIRDAVRAVWPGEQRDASAAFGAIFMALLVSMSYGIVLDASLRFLGLGMPRIPLSSLGDMLGMGSQLLARAPWLSIYPGMALTALASSLILIGYGTLGLLRWQPSAAAPRTGEARRFAEA